MYILGISAYYHDSAAALIFNGKVVAAAQEERFSRRKNDPQFPSQAVKYCLNEAGIELSKVSAIVFYDKPILKLDRILETFLAYVPRGWSTFIRVFPPWLRDKFFLKKIIKKELSQYLPSSDLNLMPRILFTEHHQAHASSAFFASPFQQAAVLCVDGVGEWATTSVWLGNGNVLVPQWELHFPHSLGLLYSAFTYYTGFKVNSGEYKLMGLAPYGKPTYVQTILENLIDLKDDGTFRLNMDYFDFAVGLKMTSSKFNNLFGGPPRTPESQLTQKDMDVAKSIQTVIEEVLLRICRTIYNETGSTNLCMAGGVALNCVANGRILREGPFRNIWIQPAAGDAGGALGAALAGWHQYFEKPRNSTRNGRDLMEGCLLGPGWSDSEIKFSLEKLGAVFNEFSDQETYDETAKLLDRGSVVGWFQGRTEYGPRSLGSRSILADARNPQMKSILNSKIKLRESFRPFAPIVLAEDAENYFELNCSSPYMLFAAKLKSDVLTSLGCSLPAITHVDNSARVQTVHEETSPTFYRLLSSFKKLTNCSVLINTSFNVRGEPIVNTVQEAYNCFCKTDMDYLVIGNFVLDRTKQTSANRSILREFDPD